MSTSLIEIDQIEPDPMRVIFSLLSGRFSSLNDKTDHRGHIDREDPNF